MIGVFLAVFAYAAITTLVVYILIEEDVKADSERPIWLLLSAIVSWSVSIGLLLTPSYVTTTYPANAIYAGSPAVSVVQEANSPPPAWASATYGTFAAGMAVIDVLLLLRFMGKLTISILDGIGKV
jgi:hypothetical protein